MAAVIQSLLAWPAFQILAMFSGVSFSNSSSFTSLSKVYWERLVFRHIVSFWLKHTGAEESYGNWDLAAIVEADAFLVVSTTTLGSIFLGFAALNFFAASSLIFCFNSSTVKPSLNNKKRGYMSKTVSFQSLQKTTSWQFLWFYQHI